MIRFTLPDVNGKPFSNRAGLEILGFFCGDPIQSIMAEVHDREEVL